MKLALEAIASGVEAQLEYLDKHGRKVEVDPGEYTLVGEYDNDARYVYPARARLVRNVAICALDKQEESDLIYE